jgi:hypothetical protein
VLTRKDDELKSGSSTALTAWCLGGLALVWYFSEGLAWDLNRGYSWGGFFVVLGASGAMRLFDK